MGSITANLANLLKQLADAGVVLDYVFLEQSDFPEEPIHHRAALAGITEMDRRLEDWAHRHTTKDHPLEMFFRLKWDESRLRGQRVTFAEFWGSDDTEPKPIGDRAWSVPQVDGYKTAFFLPPYGLRGSREERTALFDRINHYVFSGAPQQAEIYAWSTDWSNYFEAGHEWWGAFYWTIRPKGSSRIVVIGASSTD